jgi:phosphoribosylformylglycinamidine synthase I
VSQSARSHDRETAASRWDGTAVGVVVFPGSNDDRDLAGALERLGARVEMIWHKDTRLPDGVAGIAIPGGFSYGDYLRAGSMARFSPVMRAVLEHAEAGRPVLGICNGFQILCESGLLPGALVGNRERRFLCRDVRVQVCDPGVFRADLEPGRELCIPVKHKQGAYVPDPVRPPRIAFRYAPGENPNGSVDDIAGVVSEAGHVLGLMPHPEHAVDPLLGSTDGCAVLRSFLARVAGAA